MKRYKLYSILICYLLIFQSCEKFLDKKNDDRLVVPKTLEDLQAILNDVTIMNTNTPAFMEETADDFFVTDATFDSDPYSQPLHVWEPFIYNHAGAIDWSMSYLSIYNSNLVLELIENIDRNSNNEVMWNNIKGSALFYRAFRNLNLCWSFSKAYDEGTAQQDLGIVIRLGSDFNVPSVRASVKESYQHIISDLDAASQYLANNPINPYRPSKAAVYGLFARTYLSMRNYELAYKYANLALELKNDLVNFNNSSDVGTGNNPFKPYPYNKEVVFYSEMSNSTTFKAPSNGLIDTVLYSSYATNDKRKTVFFRANGKYQRFKGTYASSNLLLFSGIATDELYLIRAEAHARSGRVTEAMADLNLLLQNRYLTGQLNPLSATTKEQALAFILTERRKELLMRGLRWMDLKRLNKEGANITLKRVLKGKTYTLPPNDNRYAIPLPNDIIQLTGMPQNPR
ncbi:RagB/SusD family nutrient uptake outer membrane protein [Pedobacter heparinus]|uniref:RagB/SusD family nutrient uptake outer membrane protein n=1 Tax=Pedobacter heparinus TaxID=984 RepID=UPI00292E0842|nr:RagB/SusD family nutrient uptake outer membrane protein [Pedobacter heparinus]